MTTVSATGVEAVLDGDPYVRSHPFGRPFWRAAAEGRFLVPRCMECGRAHWYPRPFCPFCASQSVQWQESTGGGRVYAFSALRRAGEPNIVAYVQLDEGPIMLTNLVSCRLDEVQIGQAVEVRFRATGEGRSAPVFIPVAA